ncbi:hypothetical protein BCR42DRAFT_413206 [Absidia repens]|uniref:Uncharacterized protein n=1 Tax=Absidia repens TaxID=90262 RepID=A0A1X2IKP9_9FUNG|nr:hypothetical protein BCR42DRAFT_413206 [Absidia repens]
MKNRIGDVWNRKPGIFPTLLFFFVLCNEQNRCMLCMCDYILFFIERIRAQTMNLGFQCGYIYAFIKLDLLSLFIFLLQYHLSSI